VIVLNKIDLADLVDFERDFFYKSVRALNRHAPIFEVSCRTGAGLEEWAHWLLANNQIRSRSPLATPDPI
jgi:hydrogenase nickel incorporation protein HypB